MNTNASIFRDNFTRTERIQDGQMRTVNKSESRALLCKQTSTLEASQRTRPSMGIQGHFLLPFPPGLSPLQVSTAPSAVPDLPCTTPTGNRRERKVKMLSHSVSNSATHGLQPARLLCLWKFPGKNTGVGCHSLLKGIFPTWTQPYRRLNPRSWLPFPDYF